MSTLIEKHQSDSAYQIAQAYAFRGQTDNALGWLERAYKQRGGGLIDLKVDPFFRSLRHEARYIERLKKMHLPS